MRTKSKSIKKNLLKDLKIIQMNFLGYFKTEILLAILKANKSKTVFVLFYD